MNKENLNQLLKEFVVPILAVFLVLVFSLVFLLPKIGELFQLRDSLNRQQGEIKQLTQKLNDLNTLSEAELFDSANLLLEALPAEKDFYRNLVMTRQIFSEENISFNSFKSSPGMVSTASAQPASLSPLSVEVTFNASFESFKSMVAKMEKMLPLTKIDSLKFTNLEASGSAILGSFSGKMSIISFFWPLPKTLGRIEQPLPKISNQDRELIEELKAFNRYRAPASVESPSSVEVGKDNPFPI